MFQIGKLDKNIIIYFITVIVGILILLLYGKIAHNFEKEIIIFLSAIAIPILYAFVGCFLLRGKWFVRLGVVVLPIVIAHFLYPEPPPQAEPNAEDYLIAYTFYLFVTTSIIFFVLTSIRYLYQKFKTRSE